MSKIDKLICKYYYFGSGNGMFRIFNSIYYKSESTYGLGKPRTMDDFIKDKINSFSEIEV